MIKRNYFKIVRVFPDPSDYFYFKNEGYEDINIWLEDYDTEVHSTIEVKVDNGSWTDAYQAGAQTVHPNSKFYVRGADGFWKDSNDENGISFGFDGSSPLSVGGDIRTLLDYTDVDSITTIPVHCFSDFIVSNELLIDASNLIFTGITSVGDYGMLNMFYGCSSLISGPDLSSITSLGDYGLQQMYTRCSSLNEAYAPNVSTWNNSKTSNWLMDVAPTGVLYKPANLTIPTGDSGVPSGWTTKTYPQN